MYTKSELKNGFFFNLGIIAIPFGDLSNVQLQAWKEKYNTRFRNTASLTDQTTQEIYEEFGQYVPEFAKITSIAYGLFDEAKDKSLAISVDELKSNDEAKLMQDFALVLEKIVTMTLGGYNIINYQIPFLVKKMLVHKVKLPFIINLRNKKPWDISSIDVMRDYQGNMFGDVSLHLVAEHFGLVSLHGVAEEMKTTMRLALAMCTQ